MSSVYYGKRHIFTDNSSGNTVTILPGFDEQLNLGGTVNIVDQGNNQAALLINGNPIAGGSVGTIPSVIVSSGSPLVTFLNITHTGVVTGNDNMGIIYKYYDYPGVYAGGNQMDIYFSTQKQYVPHVYIQPQFTSSMNLDVVPHVESFNTGFKFCFDDSYQFPFTANVHSRYTYFVVNPSG